LLQVQYALDYLQLTFFLNQSTVHSQTALETFHEDMVHDAQLDYYGKRLATCSSDRSIKIFEIEGENRQEIVTLKGILASCSYDSKVIIWKEQKGSWKKIKEYTGHTASGMIRLVQVGDLNEFIILKDDGSWDARTFEAHTIGANSVKDTNEWKDEETLEGHTDWVRDVAWAPNVGLPKSYLASCSQDKTVFIWTQDTPNSTWNKKPLRNDKFLDVVWRVSWSLSGNVLAVACGDNKVTLWKENLKGEWELLSELAEQ
ncbi:14722_t:CDS:2, partial [Racocetra fulgida]